MTLSVYYGKSVHGREEINSVVKVLKTSTQMGINVKKFEAKINTLLIKIWSNGKFRFFCFLLAFEALWIP